MFCAPGSAYYGCPPTPDHTVLSKDGDHTLSLNNPLYCDLIGSIKNRGIAKAVDYLARSKDADAKIADFRGLNLFSPDHALYFNLPKLPPGVNGHESDPDGIPLPPGTFRATSVYELRAILTDVLRATTASEKSGNADVSSTPGDTVSAWDQTIKGEPTAASKEETEVTRQKFPRSLDGDQGESYREKHTEDAAVSSDKEKDRNATNDLLYSDIVMAIKRIEEKLEKLEAKDGNRFLQRSLAHILDIKRQQLRDLDLEGLFSLTNARRSGEDTSTRNATSNTQERTNPEKTDGKENTESSSSKYKFPEIQEWFTRQDKPGVDWDADVPPSMNGKFCAKVTRDSPKAGWIDIEGNNGSRFGFDIATARKLLGLNDTIPEQGSPSASTVPPETKKEKPEQSGKPEEHSIPLDEIEFKPINKRVTLMDILRGTSGSPLSGKEEVSSQSTQTTEGSDQAKTPELPESTKENQRLREGRPVEFVGEGIENPDPFQNVKGLEEADYQYRQKTEQMRDQAPPTELLSVLNTLVRRIELQRQELSSFEFDMEKNLESKVEEIDGRIDHLSALLEQVLQNQEKAAQEAAAAKNTEGCVYTTDAGQSDGKPKVPVAVRLDEEDERRIQDMVDRAGRIITNDVADNIGRLIHSEIDGVPAGVARHLQAQMPNMVQKAVNQAMIEALKTEAFKELVEAAVNQVAEARDQEDFEDRVKDHMDRLVYEVIDAFEGVLEESLADMGTKLSKLQKQIKGT
ncbi:hypothetical protein AA313_de0209950 [Arthrobotrys entomopaga]|nr:hypothetical protein AA313_de0209950 [Arthrobotrys entomopaga]